MKTEEQRSKIELSKPSTLRKKAHLIMEDICLIVAGLITMESVYCFKTWSLGEVDVQAKIISSIVLVALALTIRHLSIN